LHLYSFFFIPLFLEREKLFVPSPFIVAFDRGVETEFFLVAFLWFFIVCVGPEPPVWPPLTNQTRCFKFPKSPVGVVSRAPFGARFKSCFPGFVFFEGPFLSPQQLCCTGGPTFQLVLDLAHPTPIFFFSYKVGSLTPNKPAEGEPPYWQHYPYSPM